MTNLLWLRAEERKLSRYESETDNPDESLSAFCSDLGNYKAAGRKPECLLMPVILVVFLFLIRVVFTKNMSVKNLCRMFCAGKGDFYFLFNLPLTPVHSSYLAN